MAVDKLVDSTQLDSDLTSVANAIRTKGGTSASLAFPAGFVSAVQAIPTGGGSPTVTGLSAVYTQSGVVDIKDDLSVLIPDLVVTATISNTLQVEVSPTDYTLSGTFTVGTSTITVSYGGLTATFSVTVTQYWDYYWDYTDGVFPTGFTESNSGNGGTVTLTDDGVVLYSGTSTSGWSRIENSDFNNFTNKAEQKVIFSVDKTTGENGFRNVVGNGTSGAGTNTISSCIRDAIGSAGGIMSPLEVGKEYELSIAYNSNNNTFSASVDGFLCRYDLSASGMQYTTSTRLWSHGARITATVKSIRYRKDWQ